ncbi:Pro-Pol polyprotein, partial [Mucuna pruriens]
MVCRYLQFVVASQFPPKASQLYKERLKSDAKCISDAEIKSVLQFSHAASGGGHYGSTRTAQKVIDSGFYWPTIFRDTYQFVSSYDKCQKAGVAISRRHEMPQQPILFYEVFDVLDIDFMEPFPVSNGYSYILLAIDYAIATKTNDAKVVVDFLKSNIFCRFGVPKALISDQGSHFCNKAMSSLLHKYGVMHQVSTAYHPQTNGQAEDWRQLLEDALWAHRTAYRTLLGMSPYWIAFGKACHLLVEIEHRAYQAIMQCNLAYDQADKQRKLQLQELEELRLEAYENSLIYKQKVKQFHDQQILRKEFQVGQKVLVFKSCLKLIVVELKDENTNSTFQVNEHQIKLFHEGPAPIMGEMESISLMELAPPDDSP